MEKERHYSGIKRRLMFLIVLISLAPLALIAIVNGYQFKHAYESKVLEHLEQVVKKHKQNIDTFLNENLADLRVIANTYPYEQFKDEAFLSELLRNLQAEHGGMVVDMGLVDDQGVQAAYSGPFKLGKAVYADATWFKEAMGSQNYISDVFMGLRGLPHFIVATKISADGREWLLRCTIDFMGFNRLVENIRIGETGLAFIINRQGAFQTKPGIQLDAHVESLRDLVWGKHSAVPEPNHSHVNNWPGPQYKDFATAMPVRAIVADDPQKPGATSIYVMTQLKQGQWALIYRQDTHDAFSAWYKTRNVAVIIFLFGSLSIFFMAFLVSAKTVKRLEMADREKEMMNEKVIEAGKLASLGELAAGIAHEINNPVAIMVEESGWIGDLLEEDEFGDTENVAEISRSVAQIKTQGDRCKEITHKLLSFARRTDPRQQEVNMNELIGEVVDLSSQRAKYANVKVHQVLDDNLNLIQASPSELQQVLLNLINNAIDAIDHKQGGEVTISTENGDGVVNIHVADTGQGIPDAVLKRVFDPFFTTKPVGKGTGLGLSICYGIIEKMGGKISVNSSVGVGATFHISLPASRGEKNGGNAEPVS
ncbi:histidine kinase [Desulfatibacillum aliphaticivorans]|uniref:histidine kinase n=1 Tax=Desulfatibacillum aliphaticivorans TaxID=218208 RepID=B8FIF2_DESAL|nr:sensor histidine kinase [Desulfatibacillum aliphaticivorans]ACL03942.1 histidine kinase [Desulfatibacillum aliphaticivorans]